MWTRVNSAECRKDPERVFLSSDINMVCSLQKVTSFIHNIENIGGMVEQQVTRVFGLTLVTVFLWHFCAYSPHGFPL